jgi:hypothetical protein
MFEIIYYEDGLQIYSFNIYGHEASGFHSRHRVNCATYVLHYVHTHKPLIHLQPSILLYDAE